MAIDHIYTIYGPRKQALQTHGTLKVDITRILMVISITETVSVKILAVIAQLVSFKHTPRDAITYK